MLRLWLSVFGCLLLALSTMEAADRSANRLSYLDGPLDPYYVGRDFPRLATPQWVGEPGVDAVVVLAIDDMRDPKKYLLAVSYYSGGIAVVDFSDPADPKELGYYIDSEEGVAPDTWSSYWYNGRIYTNDHLTEFGVGVYEFDGTTTPKTTRFFGSGPLNPQGEVNPQVQIWSFAR